MNKSLSNEKESRQLVADGSKLNTFEGTNNYITTSSETDQESDTDILASTIAEIDDPRVYLVCDQVQKVRGGYRVYVTNINDVGRAK